MNQDISQLISDLRKDYPNALDFGMGYITKLLDFATQTNSPSDIAVAFTILDLLPNMEDPSVNFWSQINARHHNRPDFLQETQGYADSVMLLIATLVAVAKIPSVLQRYTPAMEETVLGILQGGTPMTDLPSDVLTTGLWCVRQNLAYILSEFRAVTLPDGRVNIVDFMDKIAKKVESLRSNQFYKRGAWTARDTFLLYFRAIQRIRRLTSSR